MLKINIEIDVAGFERQVDDHMAKSFAPAVVEALNRAGEAGADSVRQGMMTSFDRPTQFTLDGVGVMKASIRTDGGNPSVLIYLKDTTAAYLDLQILGGTRRAGDPFTSMLWPIKPASDVGRDPSVRSTTDMGG